MYSPTVLEARCPKSGCQQGWAASESLCGGSLPCLLPASTPPTSSAPEKPLSVACLDKAELSEHLDADQPWLQYGHQCPVDLFSPSVTVPDMNLLDLHSSLASIQELLSPQEPPRPLEAENSSPDSGKQLVHYTAQPLLLMDPGPMDMGSSSLLTGSEPPKAKDPTVS